MKRKGLIVSSIVMVIVLIASLTTATYAWFSQSSSAKVTDLTVKTISSSGLAIGAYTYASGYKYYSGNLAVDKTDTVGIKNKWTSSSDDFMAGVLQFSTQDNKLGQGFLGASGDGINMWAASSGGTQESDKASVANNKPVQIVKATENESYFAVDIAVELTEEPSTSNKNLYIKQFDIAGDGAMAAASRIALFQRRGTGLNRFVAVDGQVPLAVEKSDAIFVLEPFSTSYKAGSTWGTKEAAETSFIKALGGAADPNLYANVDKSGLLSTTYPDDVTYHGAYITDTSALTDAGASINAKGIGDKLAEQTNKDQIITYSGNNFIKVGTFAKRGQKVLLRLVIWFEGEDAECAQAYADGKGLTVNIEFGACQDDGSNAEFSAASKG